MPNKLYLTLLFVVCSFCFAVAQTTFQRTFGNTDFEQAYSVKQTSDGGYIVCGATRIAGTSQDYDILLIKTNSLGDTLWVRTYGGPLNDRGFCVIETTDGGYAVTGSLTNATNPDRLFLLKTDGLGNLLWTKTFGLGQVWMGSSLKQTPDGGYILNGATSTSGSNWEIYLLKTDSSGITQWGKLYQTPKPDMASDFKFTNDGGYIITGNHAPNAGNDNELLLKTDSAGTIQWAYTFGGTTNERAYSVLQTTDGGYITSGVTNSFGSNNGLHIIKTDSAGVLVWSKVYSGYVNPSFMNYKIKQTTDGGYVIGGNSLNNSKLIKTDYLGNVLWAKRYMGYTNAMDGTDLQLTTDGGYIFMGQTNSFGAGNYDVYLIKTDSLGNSGCNDTTLFIADTICNPTIIPLSFTTIDTLGIGTSPVLISGNSVAVTPLCVSVGNNTFENSSAHFIVFPNPVTNELTINFNYPTYPNTPITISFFNIMGKEVLSQQLQTSNTKLQTSTLPAGVYFVKVGSEVKKIIKL